MKVVVYGASVTAQKDQSGFFQHLQSKRKDIDFIKIPFGASHLHYAGIAMIQKVLNERPEICILDWSTPSTKVFPKGTVERINRILLRSKIKPLWILLPRQDDQECRRECCQQIIAEKSDSVFVKIFTESIFFKDISCNDILRDIVHTNEYGANLYSSFIIDSIESISHKKMTESNNGVEELVPQIIPINSNVSINSLLKWKVEAICTSSLKIYLHAQIGPKSPIIKIELFDEGGGLIRSTERNTVDPWCYYERNMLLDLPTIANIESGSYTLVISATEENPFENITTLKPLNEADIVANHERYLIIHEASIDTNTNVYI